jgi:hypothetical protein
MSHGSVLKGIETVKQQSGVSFNGFAMFKFYLTHNEKEETL